MARDRASPPDWRRPSDYEGLREMDRPGFAWELLRRNRRYRDESHGLAPLAEDGVLTITRRAATIAARWGLNFP